MKNLGPARFLVLLLLGLTMSSKPSEGAVQSVRVRCEYEQVLAGQTFRVQIEVTTDGETPPAPAIPAIANLILQEDPVIRPSQSLVSINGAIRKSVTYHYLAKTDRIGRLSIDGVTAGGVRAAPLDVEVIDPRTQPRSNEEKPPVFVEAVLDKTEVWQGEQILFDFYIYDRLGGLRDLNAPDLENALNDFIFKRVEDHSAAPRKTIVNGQTYTKMRGIRYALFPLRPGVFEIPAIQLKARVELQSDPRDAFFSFSRARRVPLEQVTGRPVMTEPVTIKVKELPTEGRPAGFSGAVGNFSFKAGLSRKEVAVGESVSLDVTIIGNANFDTIAEPKLSLPAEIEKYDVEKQSKFDFGGDLLRGVVDYSFILIPRQEGSLVIDSLEFSYFDPTEGAYRTLKRGPFELKVNPDEGQSITYYKGKRKRIRITGQDFRHIRRTGAVHLQDEGRPVTASIGYWTAVAGPWIGYLILAAYRRRNDLLEANPDLARKVRSKGKLKERLNRAAALVGGSESEFFAELENALHDHLSAQMGAPTRGLTRPQLVERLGRTRSGPEYAEALADLLDRLDGLRYAPGETSAAVRENLLREVRERLEAFQS